MGASIEEQNMRFCTMTGARQFTLQRSERVVLLVMTNVYTGTVGTGQMHITRPRPKLS